MPFVAGQSLITSIFLGLLRVFFVGSSVILRKVKGTKVPQFLLLGASLCVLRPKDLTRTNECVYVYIYIAIVVCVLNLTLPPLVRILLLDHSMFSFSNL